MVYAGPIFYSAEHDAELLRLYRDWAADAPDGVTALLNLTTAPPLPVIPEAWHGRKVSAFIAVSTDIAEDAEGYVQALRATAGPVADLLGPMPYTVIQSLVDPLWEKGIHAYFKSANLARLDDELVDRLCELDLAAPGPQCEIQVHQMGGAVARVAEDAAVYAERSMPFVLNAVAGWRDPALGDEHVDWARTVIAAASAASTGRAYVNFLGDSDAARSSYGVDTYARLAALKSEYDPTNLFRLNQNIEPGP
jgi:Berberine and berberine like